MRILSGVNFTPIRERSSTFCETEGLFPTLPRTAIDARLQTLRKGQLNRHTLRKGQLNRHTRYCTDQSLQRHPKFGKF